MTRALIPDSLAAVEADWRFSPGLISGGHVFLTGITGQKITGEIPDSPEEQYETAFDNIALILAEGGMTLADMVDVTTYHMDLQKHLPAFRKVWNARVSRPYPAWTAVGVTEFIIPGNYIEVKVVARLPKV
ncbi:RidA family protein [Albibacillus kandeliae]|uniref:RidA family protein n=1 Tax=Albibacillus kandeliae TaxID=2174228 RepID=UPI000D690F3E|nr:RidA family protein [Albibacillus kandeliae]